MKKIVIHCASGIMNSGDEAILDVLVKELSGKYEITVISLNKGYTQKMHPGIEVIDNRGAAWKERIKACDVFLLGGGGLLQDTTTIYNVWRWLTKLKYALKHKKKTMVFANSFEPIKFKTNRRLMKKWLNQVDVITVRDVNSLEVLKQLGIEKGILTADPVFGYEKEAVEKVDYPESYITIAIRHWYDTHPYIPVDICNKFNILTQDNKKKYEKYIQNMSKVVDWINEEKKMSAVFLCFCIDRDAKVAEDILSRVHNKAMNKVINNKYQSPTELMEYIGHSRLLLGMRLHSLIYACLEKTPMAVLSYQKKVDGMVNALHIADACINIDDLDSDELISIISKVLSKEDVQKEQISVYSQRMAVAHQNNFKYLEELLEG